MSKRKNRPPAKATVEPEKAGRRIVAASSASYSGPLPPAEQLARYDQILPGLADRIVKMAESNALHRQGIEAEVVRGNIGAQRRGQVFAFCLALLTLGAGLWLVISGRTSVGIWVILSDLLVLAVVFLGGRWVSKQERAERRRELETGR